MEKRKRKVIERENIALKKLENSCDLCIPNRSIREMYVFNTNNEIISYADIGDNSIALHITENVSFNCLKKFLDRLSPNTKLVVFSKKDQEALEEHSHNNAYTIELCKLPETRFFYEIAPSRKCKNPLSYGEICVRCGKCGRTRADWE